MKISLSEKAAIKLLENAVDGLKWYIQSIPPSEDFREMYNAFEPLKEVLAKQDDAVQFEAAALYIESHFNGIGKKLVRTLKEDIKKERLQQNGATNSISDLPIQKREGVYYKKLANGSQRISNFTLTIKDRILQDDILYYRCDMASIQGDLAEDIMFSPTERCDVRKFRILIAGTGDFHFNGRDHELSGVWQFEQNNNKDARMILLVQRYGWIDERKMWLFSNCAVTNKVHPIDAETDYIKVDHYNIRSNEVQVYQNAQPKFDFKTAYSKELCTNISKAFNVMLDSSASGKITGYMGYLFLGFIPATIYSNEIHEKFGLFPFLFPYGPSGTGKSSATELLMAFFGFVTGGTRENFDDASVPGVAQAVSQLSSMPYWMDEFKDGYKFDQLKQTIKNIYNRVGTGKGGLNKRLIREVRSTLWLSGQYLPDDEAVISRSVILRFGMLNKFKTKAYKWLVENKHILSAITLQVILRKSEDVTRQLFDKISVYQEYLTSRDLAPRYAINYSIIAASLQLLDLDIPDDFDDFLHGHAQQTLNYAQEENEALVFFKELNNAWTRGILPSTQIYIDNSAGELCLRFDPIISVIQADMRKRTTDLKLSKSSMIKDYLKDVPGFIFEQSRNGVRRMFSVQGKRQQRNCIAFSLRDLPDKFQQAITDILDDFMPNNDDIK